MTAARRCAGCDGPISANLVEKYSVSWHRQCLEHRASHPPQDVVAGWLAYLSDWCAGRDPVASEAFATAALAVALGRVGPPPGATGDPVTARLPAQSGPWPLQRFAADPEPSPYDVWAQRRRRP